jgi:hypothetical protein
MTDVTGTSEKIAGTKVAFLGTGTMAEAVHNGTHA